MRLLIPVMMVFLGVFLIVVAQGNTSLVVQAQPSPSPVVTYAPGREPIELPHDYRVRLVHYATIDRADGISRDLYISAQALPSIREGQDLPERTLVVIEAFESRGRDEDGRLIRTRADPEIHVAEARSTWQIADLAATSRVGSWNFGAFDARDGAVWHDAGLNDCFSCHESVSTRNFLFSQPLLEAFVETGEVQYRFCQRSGRSRCF